MLLNYFKIAYRNLLKNKVFSLINILGLAIGMAACLLILQYVSFELSYDDFHEKGDRIYRVQHDRYLEGELQYQKAQAFIPTGEAMMNEFPEVLEYCTLFPISEQSDIIVTYQPENGEALRFTEKNIYHVKGNFFEIFSFPIIAGERDIKQLAPNTIFISASAAKKYFGDTSPIGKTLSHNYAKDYKIVGIFEDIPENSHLKFDFLFAWKTVSDEEGADESNWRWDGFYTYLLLNPEADVRLLESKFPDFINKYQIGLGDATSQFALQPLSDIHLYSHLQGEAAPNGNANIVFTLLLVAFFVLLIAWINYINLYTARSIDRAKEVGIRKAIGSGKIEIIKQFLVELLMTNLLAVLMALTLVQLLYATFSDFAGIGNSFTFFEKLAFGIIALLLLILGSFLVSLYPTYIVSSFEPVKALKGKYNTLSKESFFNLRHSLLIFQFFISISLITAILVVYEQLSFMKSQSLGISIDNTLVVNTQATFGPPGSDSLFRKRLNVLKEKLDAHSMIKGTTASYDIPGKEHLSSIPNFRHAKHPEKLIYLYFTRIDYDYIPTFNVHLVAGRNFKERIDDQYSMIMNVEAIQALGFKNSQDAIGYEVSWGNQQNISKAKIVGVVDFRSTSFKTKNYPIAFTSTFFPFKYISIQFDKINGENVKERIAIVKSSWEEVFPEMPFEYFFLDDFFNQQYQAEQKFSQLLGVFTLLAIIVACLGLYAITSLNVVRRTKEVGIRKILGASVQNLLLLLSQKVISLILLAGMISLPLVYLAMEKWLENYAFRIDISWWILGIPIIAMLMIALITISFQTIRAALANPVGSLRYE